MKFIKKFESFISGDIEEKPVTKPSPDTKPSDTPRPNRPGPIPNKGVSPVSSPAKARLKTATADDVSRRFIDLINKSGDDIKKYVEQNEEI